MRYAHLPTNRLKPDAVRANLEYMRAGGTMISSAATNFTVDTDTLL